MTDRAPGNPRRRRNGRQQACEPCRRRKVACDHRLPVCSRCRRGKIADSCIYLAGIEGGSTAASSPLLALTTPKSRTPEQSADVPAAPRTECNLGYLGATSASAVFEETQSTLFPVQEAVLGLGDEDDVDGFKWSVTPGVETCAATVGMLKDLPDRVLARFLFKSSEYPLDGWRRLGFEQLLESVWDTFGRQLDGQRNQTSLANISRQISHNSSKTLQDTSDPEKWLKGFSGPNLRWESLGILFTHWADGALALRGRAAAKDKDGSELPDGSPMKLALRYKANALKCIELCGESCSANALFVILLYRHIMLESVVSGDTEIRTWRAHGDAVSMTTFLGLHVSPRANPNDASLSAQIKRRLFAAIFNMDKMLATFTGRPPLLSGVFCSTPLPLDMSNETLFKGPATTATTGASPGDAGVDEQGWNLEGVVLPTTVLRARTMMAFVRDDILRIALRDGERVGGEEQLLNLRNRQVETTAQFPAGIIYQADDLKEDITNASLLYAKLIIRLEHLQNLFFIERLLSKGANNNSTYSNKDKQPSAELVAISHEMVSLTLVFWTHQNVFDGLHGAVEWLVMLYAAPAGGVLCMELLKSMEAVASTGSTESESGAARVSRSDIVQQLSLLASFLDWVGPTAANTRLVSSVKRIIRHALDQALNTAVTATGRVDEEVNWSWDWDEGGEMPADGSGLFDFGLLDTFEWLRPGVGG